MQDRRIALDEAAAGRQGNVDQLGLLYEGVAAKDPGAIDAAIDALGKVSPMDPRAAAMFRQYPERLIPALERIAGIQQPEPKPQQLYQTEAGFLPADQAVGKMPYRAPPQPQQYGPESFSTEYDAEGNMLLVGNRGTIRETGRKGPVKGGDAGVKTDANPLGLNDRQQAGMNMQRENAISYAANLTGMSRDDVVKIYQQEGPDGVAKLVRERGGRFLQGARARVVEGVPFVGKGIVEATNADLIAPAKGGGAGIALFQNPTGPVTTPDFQAGEAQFPNARYPLDTQAEMLRQMLTDPAGAKPGAKPAEQGGDPLAQYAGQVIRQNGKRYQVIKARDGKFVAVEVK
jgi:hypothetical protein